MVARFGGICAYCDGFIKPGQRIAPTADRKVYQHVDCWETCWKPKHLPEPIAPKPAFSMREYSWKTRQRETRRLNAAAGPWGTYQEQK